METVNDFVFTPGIWLGQGKISFASSSEFIKFYTKWVITQEIPNVMKAVQVVELFDVEEPVINTFMLTEITPTKFTIQLESNSVGAVMGTGLRSESVIAWEFTGQDRLEGFEVYEKQENGDYYLRAEYGNSENYRAFVEGLISQKEGE